MKRIRTLAATAVATVAVVALAASCAPDAELDEQPRTARVTDRAQIPAPAPSPAVAVADVPRVPATVEGLLAAQAPAPASIKVAALDIDMPVVPVGVERNGDMEIPVSALDVGWYRHGASPLSGSGNVVMAAHVDDGRVGLGPFSRLRDVNVGDTVEVTLHDGTLITYEVSRVEQTSKSSVDMDAVFAGGQDQHLVLVTCGGAFDWSSRNYEDNVVVWALPQD